MTKTIPSSHIPTIRVYGCYSCDYKWPVVVTAFRNDSVPKDRLTCLRCKSPFLGYTIREYQQNDFHPDAVA